MTCIFPQWHKEVASKRVLWIFRKRRSLYLLPLLEWCQIAWIGPSQCSKTREFANTVSQTHSQTSTERAKKWWCTEIISAWSKYFPLCKLTLPNSRGFVSFDFSRGWIFWLYLLCSLHSLHVVVFCESKSLGFVMSRSVHTSAVLSRPGARRG